jgi:chemotaxis signal transduction protein
MNEPVTTTTGTAQALRHAFDRSFSQAPVTHTERFENMLAVRIRGDAYVIPVAGIRALYADRRVVALPTPLAEFLGVATFRGHVAPVYDLAALLGYAHRAAPRTVPRWFVLARWRDTVAFAFEGFEALLLVPPEHVVSPVDGEKPDATRAHLRGAVRAGEALRPIVHLPSVLDEIQKRVEVSRLTKER